jgi:hypothetical protein
MSITTIKVSFQSNPRANQAVNRALVGHHANAQGPGPYERIGTGSYAAIDPDPQEQAEAFAEFHRALDEFDDSLDSYSINVMRRCS